MGLHLFPESFDLLATVLDMRSRKHKVIAANIANADTPGYKSLDLKFEDELQKSLPPSGKLKLATTQPGHMPQKNGLNDVKPSVNYEARIQRSDGNTVDMDREFVKMSENQLMYRAVSEMLDKKFKGLMSAIKEVK